MSSLKIPYITFDPQNESLNTLSERLDTTPAHALKESSWKERFPYHPEVQFHIAYNEAGIFLKYQVSEESTRAKYAQLNEAVYTDSCVEFFISLNNTQYYNFEFNCIGTPLVGYGIPGDRERLSHKQIFNIRTLSSLGDQPFEEKSLATPWTLTIFIPTDAFLYDPDLQLEGLSCTANFYKCGDELAKPHYISWSPIEYHKPNFHLPQFFGKIAFEKRP
ncbi:carbohydrate-binding family 9-like protein [Rapidithrix thailandica]|uniref:Carbohydrate-binding family 9-like protein n=1 Tax=Rapidithrix thailandica TaxID=413964 RepID=A0AAW9S753_9BACT